MRRDRGPAIAEGRHASSRCRPAVRVGNWAKLSRGGLADEETTNRACRAPICSQRRAHRGPQRARGGSRGHRRPRSARGRQVRVHSCPRRHALGARRRPRLRAAAPRPRLAEVPRSADRARHRRRARRQHGAHRRRRGEPCGEGRAGVPPAQPAHARARRRRRRLGAAGGRAAQRLRPVVGPHRAGARRADRAAAVPLLFGRQRAGAELLAPGRGRLRQRSAPPSSGLSRRSRRSSRRRRCRPRARWPTPVRCAASILPAS